MAVDGERGECQYLYPYFALHLYLHHETHVRGDELVSIQGHYYYKIKVTTYLIKLKVLLSTKTNPPIRQSPREPALE